MYVSLWDGDDLSWPGLITIVNAFDRISTIFLFSIFIDFIITEISCNFAKVLVNI